MDTATLILVVTKLKNTINLVSVCYNQLFLYPDLYVYVQNYHEL